MSAYDSLSVLSVAQITWHQTVGRRMWKETIVACFEVLSLHVPEVTHKVYGNASYDSRFHTDIQTAEFPYTILYQYSPHVHHMTGFNNSHAPLQNFFHESFFIHIANQALILYR
jgi:hypothetical protein